MHVPFSYVLWTEVTDTGRGTAVPLIENNADNKSTKRNAPFFTMNPEVIFYPNCHKSRDET